MYSLTEVWERQAFGYREKKFVNPENVTRVVQDEESPDHCRVSFVDGITLHVEGSAQKIASLFRSEMSEML